MATAAAQPTTRRPVKYRGYEMILEDAETIAAGDYVTVGKWSFGQIMQHLAKTFEHSIDGPNPRFWFPIRWFGAVFLKGRLLNHTPPAGFKIPGGSNSPYIPSADTTTEAGLEALRRACQRLTTEKRRDCHPLLGHLDQVEWDRFNLRHAELHMSFVVPIPTDEEQPDTQTAASPEPSHAT